MLVIVTRYDWNHNTLCFESRNGPPNSSTSLHTKIPLPEKAEVFVMKGLSKSFYASSTAACAAVICIAISISYEVGLNSYVFFFIRGRSGMAFFQALLLLLLLLFLFVYYMTWCRSNSCLSDMRMSCFLCIYIHFLSFAPAGRRTGLSLASFHCCRSMTLTCIIAQRMPI